MLKYLFKLKKKKKVAHQSAFCVKPQHTTSATQLYHCWHHVYCRAEGGDVLTLRNQCQSCKGLADMRKDREGKIKTCSVLKSRRFALVL